MASSWTRPAIYHAASAIPLLRDPFSTNTIVAYPANVALAPFTDPYFRGFDNSLPDYYRYKEWARDFDANYADSPWQAQLAELACVEPGSLHARSHRKLRDRD